MRKPSQQICSRLALAGLFVGMLTLVTQFALVAAAPAKAKSAPKPSLSGCVQLVYSAPSNVTTFSYAVLYVDGQGCCIANSLPLRFELDTTTLTNGTHAVKVTFFDDNGKLADLPTTSVVIKNHLEPTFIASAPDSVTPPVTPSAASRDDGSVLPPLVRHTYNNLTVFMEESPFEFAMAPYMSGDRTMALLRPLVSAAGGDLDWRQQRGMAYVNGSTVYFRLGRNTVVIDGRTVTLPRPLVLRNERVFAPICLWRDVFTGIVEFEEAKQIVRLYRLTPAPAQLASAR